MRSRFDRRTASSLIVLAAALLALQAAHPGLSYASPAGADAKEARQDAGAVDVNTASVEELMAVPGIGQVIAQRIVEFREKNGPYKTVEDLLKVQGIGEKSLAKIRERLAVGKPRK